MRRSLAAAVEAMKVVLRNSQKESRTILITLLRWNISILLFTTIFYPEAYQPFLDWLWSLLRQLRVYQWSTFETIWTVFWYGAIEDLITVAYVNYPEWRLAHQNKSYEEIKQNPPRTPKGMRRPSRRGLEALIYIAPLLAMDLLMIKKFADVPLTDMLESGNYDLNRVSSIGNHKSTFLVPTLHNSTLSSPLQTKRALPPHAPSSQRVALELIFSFVLYDALFFLFHLALHVTPGLRSWHHPHHSHAEMQPQITNQLSVFERLGLVLLANFSLNIIGSHVLTRTLFIPIFVWLLVEIHTGLDLPWAYEKVLPQGWGGGARKHAAHHRDGSGGFEPYFNWLDVSWEALLQFTAEP